MQKANKTAIITGASRGIGKAAAIKLAKEGCSIAAVYAGNTKAMDDVANHIRAEKGEIITILCDVSDFEACRKAVDTVINTFGAVDILINNAGIAEDGLVMKMSEDQFDRVIDVNLKGTFNMIRHCYRLFAKQRSGSIINIASVAALMGNAGQANYSAAKAGIIGLTKAIARELAPRNIRCNAVAPGFIETDMTENLHNSPLLSAVPLKRMGTPEEVASLIAFLAKDESAYITGEVIRIDGGLSM